MRQALWQGLAGDWVVNRTDHLPAWGELCSMTKYISFRARLPKFKPQLRPWQAVH